MRFVSMDEPSEYQNILYMCTEGEPTISEYRANNISISECTEDEST